MQIGEAFAAENLILASSGAHALEDWQKIIDRKSADISRVKHAVWIVNSNAARPDAVQNFCKGHGARLVLFVSRARPTRSDAGTSREKKSTKLFARSAGLVTA